MKNGTEGTIANFRTKSPWSVSRFSQTYWVWAYRKHAFATDNAKQIGVEIAQRIAHNWGGEVIYIPRNLVLLLNERDMKIFNEFNGHNHRALARKYNVSMQWIYAIVKRITKEEIAKRQMDLFGWFL